MNYLDDEFIEFLEEAECTHDRRIVFQLANCVAYECPACGDVIREGRNID